MLILSASMGAGHDGAAAELARRLRDRGHRTETADFLECFPLRLGRLMRWVYGMQLKRAPWAYEATFRVWYLTPLLCRALVLILWVLTRGRLRRMMRPLEDEGLACVVSTYPLTSLVLGRGRARGRVKVPVATFITDFGVHPLWIHPAVDLTMCVHESSAAIAGAATGRRVVTTGPMVSDAFGRAERATSRASLGLPADARVALVVSGSWGVGDLEATFDALLADGRWLPVAACGRNEALRARLAARGGGVALGWTDRMPELMAAADVLVQNAGGLSCMEAFAAGLPVVTFHPIPGHGRENAAAMETAGVAATVSDASSLGDVLDRVTRTDRTSMTAAGRSLFRADAAAEIEALAGAHRPTAPAPGRRGPARTPVLRGARRHRRRAVAGALGLAVAYGGLNLVADAATAHGVDAARAERGASDVYVAVRLGPDALASPDLAGVLSADRVTAVVDGRAAAADPAGVRRLVRAGVDVATGGWDGRQPFHWEAPSDGLIRSTRAIRLAAGLNCHEFAPISGVSGVDLASALMHHVRIVRGSKLVPLDATTRPSAGRVYILRGDRADGAQVERGLTELLLAAEHDGLLVEPLSDLR